MPTHLDSIKHKMKTSLDRLKEQSARWYEKKEEVWGLPTGIATLDSLTGGLQQEELITIAGSTGGGKTAFLTQVMERTAAELTGPRMNVFFSLEMSARSVYLRSGARRAGLNSQNVRRGRIEPQEKRRFDTALEELVNLPYLIVDDPALTSLDIVNLMQFLTDEGVKPAVVGLDYIQHLADEGMPSHTAITGAMRRMAQLRNNYECSVVVLSQYSREYLRSQRDMRGQAVDCPPELWHLKESGSIENNSEQVWMLHVPVPSETYEWEVPHKATQRKLYIRKNRNGPLGERDLWFVEPLTYFADDGGMVELANRLQEKDEEEPYEPDDDPNTPAF